MASKERFPFPFVGSGDASYFEWGEVFVQFTTTPTPAVQKKIAALVPPPLQTSRAWAGALFHAGSGQTLHRAIDKTYPAKRKTSGKKKSAAAPDKRWFFADEEQVEAFNLDIVRWLLEAHALCPILVAYRAQDGESGGTRLDAWHKWSVKKVPELLPSFEGSLAPDAEPHGVFVLEGLLEYVRAAGPALVVPPRFSAIGAPVNYKKIIADSDVAGMRAALARRTTLDDEGRNALVHGGKYTDTSFAAMVLGVYDLPAVKGSKDRAVLAAVMMAAMHLHTAKGTAATLKKSAAAALDLVKKRIAQEPDMAYDFGGYAFDLVGQGRWEAALETYELALKNKHNADLSTYNNALWHVNPAINGLPLDAARAKRFLAVCVPHGEDQPNILVNAAYLYLSLGDTKKALAHAKLAVTHGYNGKELVKEKELAQLRSLPAFMALAK